MQIDILTLFPGMFTGPFTESIVKRAQEKGKVTITIHDLRKWSEDERGTVDDRPYGGGTGMVMKVDVMEKALKEIKNKAHVILLTPQGQKYDEKRARELSKLERIVLICGHYEGFDERIREHLVDEEISIGDYVLTGGELPAMVVTDSIVRLIPGVLEKEDATINETFNENLLEYPQYTRPEDYNGWKVPEILLSGNHAEINKWRKAKSIEITKKKRPDLISSSD